MYAPLDRIAPLASAIVVDMLCGLILAGWSLALVAVAVRELLRARSALAGVATRPRPGVHTLVGIVRGEAGSEGPPVTLTVQQRGEQGTDKHGPYVLWRETDRAVSARPFYLELSSGERVRVEPAAQGLRYVDDLAVSTRAPGAAQRARCASLDLGETAFVRGEVTRGRDPRGDPRSYRDAGAPALVLRPASDGMLISTRPVDRVHRRRASHHLVFSALGIALLGACQLWLFAPFRDLRRTGEPTFATATGFGAYTSRHRGRARTHYMVEVRLSDGRMLRDEVSGEAWRQLRVGASVPVTLSRGGRRMQVGHGELGVTRPQAVVACTLSLGLLLLHAVGALARREWYERRSLNDRERGRL